MFEPILWNVSCRSNFEKLFLERKILLKEKGTDLICFFENSGKCF